ncbi:hypothetical protein [Sphingobium yanoikuyae]|uniref:hypothetical protein n=1 Tax=Sphingobium yanoikuyae TaxID=13690 RepID=UPI0035C70679
MPRPLRSPAFPNGLVRFTPSDPDEAYFIDHPNLVAWISGSGLAIREMDNIWDDLAKETLSYRTPGSVETGAKPSMAFGSRPTIRINGAAARLLGSLTMPASFTVATSFVMDNPVGSQQLLAAPANSSPRMSFGAQASGYLQLNFNTGSTVAATVQGVIPAAPSVAWADFNSSTLLARLGLNNFTSGGTVLFGAGHSTPAGIGIGAFGDGTQPMTGDIGDLLIFNAVLSDADRGRLLAMLGRRSGIVVANLPNA